MAPQKHILFDVVGTCVSFAAFHDAIAHAIGPILLAHNITPQAFAHSWMTSAELEFTFLSISTRYAPYSLVLSSVFYRTLFLMGVPRARSLITPASRDACIAGYSALLPRPGLREAFSLLRSAGFEVWCLTSGDLARVKGYFAAGGVEMPEENIITCDSAGVAKPDLKAYGPAWERLGGEQTWFAAAHMWDVSAAKLVGFKGAWCGVYEEDPCEEIFGAKMDVMADGLVEMAEKIVKASSA